MLLIGPPGSGKTTAILGRVEQAVREGRGECVKLITPTASMAQHLGHTLARRELCIPGELIETVQTVVRNLTPEVTEPSPAVEELLLRQAARGVAADQLGELIESRGLVEQLARLYGEIESGGGDSAMLQPQLRGRRQRSLGAVFAEYARLLAKHSLTTPQRRPVLAAERIRNEGLGTVEEVYLDGFIHFSSGERRLVEALAERARTIFVVCHEQLAPFFPGWSVERFETAYRPRVEPSVVAAPSARQEVEEVARRILIAKRPLREIGVILRSPESYAAVVEVVFERYGIPYRLRRQRPLGSHPAVAFLLAFFNAVEGGFPGRESLETLLSPYSRIGLWHGALEWELAVRKRLPGSGFEFLAEDAPDSVRDYLTVLENLQVKLACTAPPADWAELIGRLRREHLRPPDAQGSESVFRAFELRGLGAALAGFDQACKEAAGVLELEQRESVDLRAFLDALARTAALTQYQVRDTRRDVVNVLSVHEARQWELPVVFVIGMVEGGFPQRVGSDLFFSDSDRRRLQAAGIAVRGATETEEEERFLFEIASSRASESLTLSWPQTDADGGPLLRSFFLPIDDAADQTTAPVRPLETAPDYESAPPATLDEPGQRNSIRERNAKFSPSGLETYLQCPFQFFAKKTLRLKGRPEEPERRIDALLKGSIIHSVVAQWSETPERPIGEVLDKVFDESLQDNAIPASFLVDIARQNMRSDLERFAREHASAGGLQSTLREGEVEFLIDDRGEPFTIGGRLDRGDIFGEQVAVVIDYKYSKADRLRAIKSGHDDGSKLQASLYLAGLERGRGLRPGGAIYWGLRGETSAYGWLAEDVAERYRLPKNAKVDVDSDRVRVLVDEAERSAAEAVIEIRSGRIEAAPLDRSFCARFCDFRDVCRIPL